MATGRTDHETKVDANQHCVKCKAVLKDAVQRHFCEKCIAEHKLKCPICKDPTIVPILASLKTPKTDATSRENSTKQDDSKDFISSVQKLLRGEKVDPSKAEIVVAGGHESKSVEAFNMETKTWRRLSQMSECKANASSVVYQDHIIVTGGLRAISADEPNPAQLQMNRFLNYQFKTSMVTYVWYIAIAFFSSEDGLKAGVRPAKKYMKFS